MDPESHAPTCTCKTTGICNCATPRAPKNRSKKTNKVSARDGEESSAIEPMAQPAALVVSANSGRNRPVLPRPSPSSHSRSSPPRTVHNPVGTPHLRSQHYSPYGRAYEFAHGGPELASPPLQSAGEQFMVGRDVEMPPVDPNGDEFSTFMNSWLASVQPSMSASDVPPISCDCGPNCSCPGCVIHRGPSAVTQGFETCVNPSTCTSCMDCTMLNALDNNPAFDDWLRRLSAPEVPSGNPSPSIPDSTPSAYNPLEQQQQQTFDASMWQTYALWSNLQNQVAGPTPPEDASSLCCNGQCKCAPGTCACPADCCGCCTGCACPSCDHEDRSMGIGSGKTLTFAVSGERAPCCGSGGQRNAAAEYRPQPGPATAGPSTSRQGAVSFNVHPPLDLRGVYEWNASSSSMDVPRVSLSRASSSSSRSSSHRSHRSSSQDVSPSPAAHTPDGAVRSCCASMQTLNTSRAGSAHSGSNSNSPIPPSFTPSHIEQYPGPPFDIEDGSPRIF